MNLDPLRRALEPATRRLLHTYWRFARGLTLGVRAVVIDPAGRVFLVKHSYVAGWHLPGGGVDRHELPALAAVREAREEAGLVRSAPAEFFALYRQKVGWIDNVTALYRLADAEVDFKKSLEIRELLWCDPQQPPQGTTLATVRRLSELVGDRPRSADW